MKTKRKLPDYAVYKNEWHTFGILGSLEIKTKSVSMSQHLPCDENAPLYSDADLRLLIAKMEVARESLVADLDKHIAILKDILEGK